MLDEVLEKLAVRIETECGLWIGSGVLWVPKGDTEYVYVFTAAHVICRDENIAVRLLNGSTREEILLNPILSCHVKYHMNFKKENDTLDNDVAVLRIQREEWMNDLPNIVFGVVERNYNVLGRGFPDSAKDNSFILAGQTLQGKIGNCAPELNRFQINLEMAINHSDRNGELSGYSGTGIFHIDRCHDELVLVGIFSCGQGVDAAQAVTNAFYARLIKEICENNGWDTPEFDEDAPLSFEPYMEGAIAKITTEFVKNEIYSNAQELIDNNVTPRGLIGKLMLIHDIPKCKKSTRLRCKNYWIANLQLLSIIQIMGVTVEEFQRPSLIIDHDGEKKNVPIEFICSEGSDGNCNINKFIRSLISCDYTWSKPLRNNSIVIWASDEVPTINHYKMSKFSNILKDICLETSGDSRRNRLDIKYGETTPNNLAIIHIHKLMENIDNIDKDDCTRDDIQACVKELFIDVIN